MKQAIRFGIAQAHLGDARYWHSVGDEYKTYRSLLLWAEISYSHPSSPRQIEQRKLASKLRQLTGCIGSLRTLTSAVQYNFYVSRAISDLQMAEKELRFKMATIKERIPQ